MVGGGVHADNSTLADIRADVIAAGTIPTTYLIEPTGPYWASQNIDAAYEHLKAWTLTKDETIPSELYQNKVNRAMFNTFILLENRTDSLHHITALAVAKERALGTYDTNTAGYLKKYHDYIIGEYNIPGTVDGITAALDRNLGDMASLAGVIASITGRAASIGGVPDGLLLSDIEYWVDTELATYCSLDGPDGATCVPEPSPAPMPANQTSGASGAAGDGGATGQAQCGPQGTGCNADYEAIWYWRALSCLSSYRGISVGVVCSGTQTWNKQGIIEPDEITKTVSGYSVYSRLRVENPERERTFVSFHVDTNPGPDRRPLTTNTNSNIIKKQSTWVAYSQTGHPCYWLRLDNSEYLDCLVRRTWTFDTTILVDQLSNRNDPPSQPPPPPPSDINSPPELFTQTYNDIKTIWRYSGVLGGGGNFNFTGTDSDGDDLTLSVSVAPNPRYSALADCNTLYTDEPTIYRVNEVIKSGATPLKNLVCMAALYETPEQGDTFQVKLSDGVTSVMDTIRYKIEDVVGTVIKVVEVIGKLAPGIHVKIAAEFAEVINWELVNRIEAWRCDHSYHCEEFPIIRVPVLGGTTGQSDAPVSGWKLVANITEQTGASGQAGAVNATEPITMTILDYDIEGNTTYTYAARILSDGSDPRFTILGNVTTPPIKPTITLAGDHTMTVEFGSNFTEPGYTATDHQDGDITGNVTVTGVVDTATIGTYYLYYDVTDSAGNAAAQQVRTVAVINTPPTADAGTDRAVRFGAPVSLDGTGSHDPGGILTYSWIQTAGDTVTLSNHTIPSPTFTAPDSLETLTFRLTVSDGLLSDTDAVTVTVQANRAPVSNAGADQAVRVGDAVSLDGTGSADPHGDPLSYMWNQTSGGTVALSNHTAQSPTFTAPATPETLVFRLTVSDGSLSATDDVTVTVQANRAPTSSAGADQTVWVGDAVSLDGTGSADPHGDPLSYMWNQTSGDTVTLSNHTIPSPTFTAPDSSGTLTFRLTVSDGSLSATDDVTVTVQSLYPLVANAGADQAVRVGEAVSLDGSGSTAPHESLRHSWLQISGDTVTLYNSTTLYPTFTAPDSPGTLEFRLTVYDGLLVSFDHVTITVQPNRAPVSNAGADQTARSGGTVTLNGTGSDPDGDAISYVWSQTAGDAVTLSDRTMPSPTFRAPIVSGDTDLVFSLGISDGVHSATDTVTVTVQPNRAPVSNAGADQIVRVGDTVSLDGTGSDPDGDAISYVWRQAAGDTVALSNHTMPSPTFTAPIVSGDTDLVFSLGISDGVHSATDTVTITVTQSNRAPTSNAGADQTVWVGDTVSLDGSGSADPHGDPLSYMWNQTSGETVDLSNHTAQSPTFTAPATPATLVFRLTVSDGSLSATDDVTVTVQANRAPTSNAGADQTVWVGDTVSLNGTGSDPDGDALTYRWSQTSGETVTFSNSTVQSPTFTAPATPATLVFRLTVSDGSLSATDDVTVTVVQTNRAPTSNAGADQTVWVNDAVSLDGSGSDPDGDAISYVWSQTAGDTVYLSNRTIPSPTFRAPDISGTLTFRLTVSDGALSATDDVTVTVQSLYPLVANAGADQTVRVGDTVSLNGTGSTALHESLQHSWRQTSGDTVTLYNSTTLYPKFTAPDNPGTLTFRLTVYDGLFEKDDTVTVTVAQANRAPTSNAGADQTVDTGDTVTLDGSGSDPDGDALTYRWSQTSGETVTLSNSTVQSPTFTAPATPATLVFRLTVSDGSLSATDDVTVTVQANRAPTSNAGADQTVDTGDTVTLDGSGSDPDGDALTYRWSQTSGETVTLSNSTVQSPTFTAPATPATLVFRLTVSDGSLSATDDVTVTVQANRAPTSNAGADQTVDTGDTVTLDGSGSDPDGDALTYRWSQTSGETVTLSNSTVQSPTFTAPATPATLVFRLTVSDGSLSATDDVTVTVQANRAPTSNAGADQTVDTGDTVTLDGSGSDPDGDALTYRWSQTSGETVTLSNSTVQSPTFTAPATPATLVFRLTVSDGSLSATDDVTVTVQANRAPTSNAGADQTVDTGDTVTLDGSGSDPDGDALTYRWSQTSGDTVTLSNSTVSSPTFVAPTGPANLTFRLTVSDGTLSDADDVTITVSQPNRAPASNAGADQTVDVGQTVTLDGSGSSDPDGDSLTYSWSQTSGGTVTLSDAAASSPTFTAPDSPATLVFQLNVTDGTLHSADTVTITVQEGAATVTITHVDGGSGFVPYTDGMVVGTDVPRFRGTSDGYDSIRLQVRDSDGTVTQIGSGTGVNDDGSFQRGRTALADGTYSIFVNSEPDRILGTFVVRTGG